MPADLKIEIEGHGNINPYIEVANNNFISFISNSCCHIAVSCTFCTLGSVASLSGFPAWQAGLGVNLYRTRVQNVNMRNSVHVHKMK